MMTKSWLYDAILYVYALSLLFSFSDVARANQTTKRIGTGLLLFVWVIQTLYLAIGLYEQRVTFVLTKFDTFFFFAWLLVTLALLIEWFVQIDLIVFGANVLGFAVLVLNYLNIPGMAPINERWPLNDNLLYTHIALAMISYVAFTLAALFAVSYLFLHRRLKEKQWTQQMQRMPSLENMDKLTFATVMIGLILLISSLVLGFVCVGLQEDSTLLYDPKVVNSFLIIAAYTFYIFQRKSSNASITKLSYMNLLAFAFVVVNVVVANIVSNFHQWM